MTEEEESFKLSQIFDSAQEFATFFTDFYIFTSSVGSYEGIDFKIDEDQNLKLGTLLNMISRCLAMNVFVKRYEKIFKSLQETAGRGMSESADEKFFEDLRKLYKR